MFSEAIQPQENLQSNTYEMQQQMPDNLKYSFKLSFFLNAALL